MKLLTHNFLQCHVKGVKNGYPLRIEAVKIDERTADYDPDFLRSMYQRLDWKAFREGAQAMGCGEGLPDEVGEELLQEDGFLQRFHHALLEVCLEEGALVCPESGRRFPVAKGIPNMLLNEDEV
ncbi:TRM112B [Scenedesmus sp. PABB004]|nr:TRM112B [Scenedesmus sp. PABB004]